MFKSIRFKSKLLVWSLIWTLIFLVLAITFQVASESPYNPRIEIKLFENQLHNKMALLQQSLLELKKEKSSDRYKSLYANFSLLNRLSDKSNGTFGYVITEKGQAKAWSKEAAAFFILDKPLVSNGVQFLGNGWYYVVSESFGKEVFWGLLCIKHEYSYQNNYLTNYFTNDFDISSVSEISLKGRLFSYPIKDVQGDHLFSITLKGKTKVSELLVLVSMCFTYLFLVASFLFISLLTIAVFKSRNRNLLFLFELVFVFIFYLLFIQLKIPQSFFEQDVFTASYFASSFWLPSLGSFTILSILISFATFSFYYHFSTIDSSIHLFRRFSALVKYTLAVLATLIFYLIVYYLTKLLVQNSTDLSVYFKVTDYHWITYLKIASLVLLSLSYHFFSLRLAENCHILVPLKKKLLVLVCFVLVAWFFSWLLFSSLHWSVLLFFFLTQLTILFPFRAFKSLVQYAIFLWLVTLYSLFLTYTLLRLNVTKETQDRHLLIENIAIDLMSELDMNAELNLVNIEASIARDSAMVKIAKYSSSLENDLRNHVLATYFSKGWEMYDIQVVGCFSFTNLKFDNGKTSNCYNYFFERTVNQGVLLANSKIFYSIDNKNGKITYLGVVALQADSENEFSIFITLESKTYIEGLGYPELLKSNSEIQQSKFQENYSIAKYVNNTLVKRDGPLVYPIEGNLFQGAYGAMHELQDDSFTHLIFHPQADTTIILSRSNVDFKNILLAFSLIFISFFFAWAAVFLVERFQESGNLFRFSIQQRIQIAFVALVLLLTFLVIFGSISLSIYRFKTKNSEIIFQKMKSLTLELEGYYNEKSSLSEIDKSSLNNQLIWLSNVFHCDVNLYNVDGRLYATSRSILFDRHLLGKQMDSEAFLQLMIAKKRDFIQDEYVSKLRYTSAYIPLYNRNSKQIAIINIPYFSGDKELQEEVGSLLVAIVNFSIFFLVLAIAIAILVASKITEPLTLIQDGLERIKIGKQNLKIEYKADDEVGKLVEVYNLMVDQLEESAAQLAKSEREDAWREMAKQIAHEIKNPLTPMKLSVQQLLRAWNDKKEGFDVYIQKVVATLVEQIDNLSAIASEFSHFAKMPEGDFEEIDLATKLSNSKHLFEKGEEVEITLSIGADVLTTTWADNSQLTTVFNNLIKNGIQSTGGVRKAVIEITISNQNNCVQVEIKDNGKGVPKEIKHRLFEPNFTTKSSGMGLGLAISKKIVESSGGSISFTTEEGVGSIFRVQLPIKNKG